MHRLHQAAGLAARCGIHRPGLGWVLHQQQRRGLGQQRGHAVALQVLCVLQQHDAQVIVGQRRQFSSLQGQAIGGDSRHQVFSAARAVLQQAQKARRLVVRSHQRQARGLLSFLADGPDVDLGEGFPHGAQFVHSGHQNTLSLKSRTAWMRSSSRY
ncbi:MAG: hypothetical protein V9H69_27895 [Anaerolineae bacterium]